MGHEIFYCFKCQARVRGSDFESGKAFRLKDKIACTECAAGYLASLPESQQAELLGEMEALEELRNRRKTGLTPPVKAAPEEPRSISGIAQKKKVILFSGIGGGLAIVLVVLIASGGGGKNGVATKTTVENASSPVAEAKNAAPQIALQIANDFVRLHPLDLPAQAAAYEDALTSLKGTPAAEEANQKLEAIVARINATYRAEIGVTWEQAREASQREEFRDAMNSLEPLRFRHQDKYWRKLCEDRLEFIRTEMQVRFKQMKEEAKEAKRQGDLSKIGKIHERLTRWGQPKLVEELNEAVVGEATADPTRPRPQPSTNLPDVKPPLASPKPAPRTREGEAYFSRWTKAMQLARVRDYDGAIKELETASQSLTEEQTRKESTADLKSLAQIKSTYASIWEDLSKRPVGQKLSLEFSDEKGTRAKANDWLLAIDAAHAEIHKARSRIPFQVEFGEVTVATFAELFKTQAGNDEKWGIPILMMCLIEGDKKTADKYKAWTSPLPQKYWDWTPKGPWAPRVDAKEMEARRALALAEKEFQDAVKKISAVAKFETLLANYSQTTCVQRNQAIIKQRCGFGKEYFDLARDFKPSGTFKLLPTSDKVGSHWCTETKSDPAKLKQNFVECEFPVLPDTMYQCWIYAGACCSEVSIFYTQCTDLVGFEIEGAGMRKEEPKVTFPSRTHGSHTRRDKKWSWIPIALPKFSGPGWKKLRIYSDREGLGIEHVYVSCVASKPPTDLAVKQVVRERALVDPCSEEAPILVESDSLGMLTARAAHLVVAKKIKLEEIGESADIGFWADTNDGLEWFIYSRAVGKVTLELNYSCDKNSGGDFQILVGDQSITGKVVPTASWMTYTTVTVGSANLPKGRFRISVKASKVVGGGLMNLREIRFHP